MGVNTFRFTYIKIFFICSRRIGCEGLKTVEIVYQAFILLLLYCRERCFILANNKTGLACDGNSGTPS